MKDFKTFMNEENGAGAIANATGDSQNMAMPPAVDHGIQRRYKVFDVDPDTFRKFRTGRVKFERWTKYLNLQDEAHRSIYDYAYKNRNRGHVMVLRDQSTGALRSIRRRSSDGY